MSGGADDSVTHTTVTVFNFRTKLIEKPEKRIYYSPTILATYDRFHGKNRVSVCMVDVAEHR